LTVEIIRSKNKVLELSDSNRQYLGAIVVAGSIVHIDLRLNPIDILKALDQAKIADRKLAIPLSRLYRLQRKTCP